MNKGTSSYFYKIAGIVLEFRFHESTFTLHREKFIENVMYNLKNFSIPKENPLHIIHFVDFREPSIFYRENEFIYLKACRKIDSNNREIYYHVNLGEFNLLFRDAIEDILAKEGGFLLHASSVCINHKAYVFLGESGAGKTTILNLLKDEYLPLGDDSIIIKQEKGEYRVFQTPLLDKEYLNKNSKSFSLEGLFILKKSLLCKTRNISGERNIFKVIMKQLIAKENTVKIQSKKLAYFLKKEKRIYQFYFPKDKKKVSLFIRKIVAI